MSLKLLDHVELLTQHRDTALLDRSVISSLKELLGVERVRLIELCRLDGILYFSISAWNEDDRILSPEDLAEVSELQPLSSYAGAREAIAEHRIIETLRDGRYLTWFPVHTGDTPIACFELEHEKALNEHQSDLAAGIIGLYRNYRALLEDSQQDTLTGLANRKTFDRSLAHFLSSASEANEAGTFADEANAGLTERRHTPAANHWLAVIDIDHFKRVNDRFGHLYGDEVLILVGNRMRTCFRQSDKLFRFGGEEFVVLLRYVDQAGARLTLERFRKRIADEQFPQVGQVTVSIGFVCAKSTDTPSNVLGSADEALYYAKGNGRNQVCNYEELVESGRLERKALHTEAEFF